MIRQNAPILKVYILHQLQKYYEDAIQAWNNCLRSCSTDSKNDSLDKNIFGNSEIKFNRNPLFFNRFIEIIYLK